MRLETGVGNRDAISLLGRLSSALLSILIAAQFPSHERVNQTDDAQELEALRRSVQRGRPFGQPEWQKEIAKRLGLESAYRPTGRPRKVGRNQNASPG